MMRNWFNPSRTARLGRRGRRRRWIAVAGLGLAIAAAFLVRRREASGAGSGVLDAEAVRGLYDRVAPVYDVLSCPYRLIDGRRLVRRGIRDLELRPGDTVVDLGTGTGWALPRLADAVGPSGRVIGVDISLGMLERARRRVKGRDNINLVHADIADYHLPRGTRGVLAAFAIEMLPDYDAVIARLVRELPAEASIAVTGLRDPDRWPEWLVRLGSALNRPFGVSNAYRNHRPWESVARRAARATYVEALGGAIYLAVGGSSEKAAGTPSWPSHTL
tara:strand:+ start:448 stop:1272 length:825 start_codon:yes stop_codon:yes gene_type:complete